MSRSESFVNSNSLAAKSCAFSDSDGVLPLTIFGDESGPIELVVSTDCEWQPAIKQELSMAIAMYPWFTDIKAAPSWL
jgi:hypothetical protein